MAQTTNYTMWQNTGFMLRTAWNVKKSVPLSCIAEAGISTARSVTELLLAPAVLGLVETKAPLDQIAGMVLLFTGLLVLLLGTGEYLRQNTVFGRVEVRLHLASCAGRKMASTSFPNLFDTAFTDSEEQAFRVCSNNAQATEQIWETWTGILTNGAGFLLYLTMLSSLHPVLILTILFTTVAGYAVNKKMHEWEWRHRDEERSCQKQMEYIKRTVSDRQYAKEIRIFGLQKWLWDVWEKGMSLYRGFLFRREKTYLAAGLLDVCLTVCRNGIAYVYLIGLVLNRDLSAAVFLLYFNAAGGFTQWVTGLLDQFMTLHRQSIRISTLREFLEWPEPFCLDGGETPDNSRNPEIRLDQVSYRYPGAKKDTIHNMNLVIRPGENVAIVGLNGAGKTTLIRLICGLLDPTEGQVLLNGKDIRGLNRKEYYGLFSAVFQESSMLEASVAENVAQRVEGIDREKVWRCLRQAGLEEKIGSLSKGMDTILGRKVYDEGIELSGGQTQRLLLARALYKDAPVLILDEPTAALDAIAENEIYLKYNEMTEGRTSFFISHRLASTRFCDRILFMKDGQVTEEGTHEELLAAGGGYARLFSIQSRYYQEGGKSHE